MSFDRRHAVFAGAMCLLTAWWAATSRKPAPESARRKFSDSRGGQGTGPDRPNVPAEEHPAELEPPAPVLMQSAERRFSSPSSNGGAAGGIAGAEDAQAPAPGAAERQAGVNVNLPGGYGAPTASVGTAAFGGGESGSRPLAGARRAAAPSADGKDGGSPPEARAPDEKKLTGAAANLVTAARGLKERGDIAAMRNGAGLEAGIMRGLALDKKVDAGIRNAIADLQSSGRPVTPEAVAKAAEGVLKENGLEPEDVDVQTAVARASGPPPPGVPPAAYAEAAKDMASTPPLEPAVLAEIRELGGKPPPPRAPAPRGALDAFRKNHDVFEKAQKDFGVKPEHILGILGVETTWGRNTGKFPIVRTLEEISTRTDSKGRRTRAAIQAENDLKALARLSAEGNLGGLKPSELRSSYAGAMGVPQFLPTSWEAYSRAPGGGKRDPFNFGTAAYSVGNYLKVHGYNKDVPRSIWGYNHSQEYVDKVLGLSADVKASLNAAAPPVK